MPLTLFENITEELTEFEKEKVVPQLLSILRFKTANNKVSTRELINLFKCSGIPMSGVRIRKMIAYIRQMQLAAPSVVIGSSEGYFLSGDVNEIEKQIDSLRQRARKINHAADSIEAQLTSIKQYKKGHDMNKSRIPEETIWKMRDLAVRDFSYTEIAKLCELSYSTVYLYVTKSYKSILIEQETLKPAERWTQELRKMLERDFEALPSDFERSKEFDALCRRYKKTRWNVSQMILALGLTQRRNLERSLRQREPANRMQNSAIAVQKRPPAEYTNLPTPYGIATDLHAGNRIFRKK